MIKLASRCGLNPIRNSYYFTKILQNQMLSFWEFKQNGSCSKLSVMANTVSLLWIQHLASRDSRYPMHTLFYGTFKNIIRWLLTPRHYELNDGIRCAHFLFFYSRQHALPAAWIITRRSAKPDVAKWMKALPGRASSVWSLDGRSADSWLMFLL
jgi:hypothetical protein